MPSVRAREWKELLDQLAAHLADLEDGGAWLLDRAATSSRWDGFPSRTLGPGGGSGGVSDPIGNGVARRLDYQLELDPDARDHDRDRVTDAARSMRHHVLEAARHLRLAVGAKTAGDPKRAGHKPPAAETSDCVNCERYEVKAVAVKDGRCWACYGYRRRSREKGEGAGLGLDAPKHLVLARPENATRRSLGVRVDPKELPHGLDPGGLDASA